MRSVLLATGGFLLAVLWMDLMFDVQVWRRGADATRESAVASIAAYYRRVTTDAFPMNRLIGTVMVLQLGGILDEVLLHRTMTGWRALLVVIFGVVPIGLAAVRIFPAAVRLGSGSDPLATRIELARAILRGHLLCFGAIAAFIFVHLRPPS